ncbi:hypothetical protein NEUTE1DRAFT_107863 [Neurospora tetrasperma FGSC 2508]|uniref:Heterokaryon incompatibility domain-containing protein n=1 Tax=Neurospora tetrasperma (strain FGSC 2508 / ATCC MYA-4615 / P0657) TaxID=510951 RepID=F8MCX3_NEUT8|nr:uncharacterized protein NEUTE1DRAFT_107863 [Neurospora tetrasperma FGSC 2508]EGO61371.1 hypothetical protein NEUTE1DRAFT_107863 [Neurospora tetrasperma FGSC 2508]
MDLRDSDDDCQQTLGQIARQHGQSIVELLVQIQKARTEEWKPTKFLQPLECLQLIGRPQSHTALRNNLAGTIKPLHSDTVTVPKLLEDIKVQRGLPRIFTGQGVSVQNEGRFMNRSHLNVLDGQTKYIAVSYTWNPPDGHDNTSGRYWIAKRAGNGFEQSPIRNSLLDRITNYMRALCVEHLWIDQHCIVQTTTCTMSHCAHDDCNEKREAVHAMDLVFASSEYPTAFLSQSIDTWWDLRLLHGLLRHSWLMHYSSYCYGVSLRSHRVRHAKDTLKLVHRLMCDPWWARAWPFQERHVTNSRLQLLWRYPPHLEKRKQALFPEMQVPGEISIQAIEFLTQADMLCRAMVRHISSELHPEEKEMIRQVFQAVVHDGPWLGSLPLIPPLVDTVISKDIAKPWDRVAIIELQYLQQTDKSLSISILALVLLNGEVLNNRRKRDQQRAADMTVSQYLTSRLCRTGYYASRCGFLDVTFTMKGIRTEGHLWKLGKVIDGTVWSVGDPVIFKPDPSKWPMDNSKDANEHRCWWRAVRCRILIAKLKASGYSNLAENLQQLLRHSITACLFRPNHSKGGQSTPPLATLEVIDAIGRGKKVRVGCLWHPGLPSKPSSYSALFVWEGDELEDPEDHQQNNTLFSTMVFTATRVNDFSSPFDPIDEHPKFSSEEGKFHRHLSLEVEIENPGAKNVVFSKRAGNLPSLKTKRWISGLHFPDICMRPSRQVVFPWPHELAAIGGRHRVHDSRPSRTKIYGEIASNLYKWDNPIYERTGRRLFDTCFFTNSICPLLTPMGLRSRQSYFNAIYSTSFKQTKTFRHHYYERIVMPVVRIDCTGPLYREAVPTLKHLCSLGKRCRYKCTLADISKYNTPIPNFII